jgi:hypothetical protein
VTGLNPESLFAKHDTGPEGRHSRIAPPECLARPELDPLPQVCIFEGADDQAKVDRALVQKVPGVGAKPAFHLLRESRRPHQMERFRPVQTKPEQAIEAGEMVHVGMGNECMADPHQLTRGEKADVAEVEEQRTPSKPEVDVDARVRKRIID